MPDTATDVPWPDSEAGERARAAADPRLGGLVPLLQWLAATGTSLDRPRLLVVGDTGDIAPAVAEQAALADCPVTAVQASGSADEAAEAADAAIDAGADLLLLAAPGGADAAAVLACLLTDTEPVKVLARGAAAAEAEAWMRRAVVVRDERRRLRHLRHDPAALVEALSAHTDTAAVRTAAAVALRAASRRTPVVLDGPAAVAGALVAFEEQPRCVRWWMAADVGADGPHTLISSRLGLRPLLNLGIDTADGTAALLGLAVLRAAARHRSTPTQGGADGD